MIPDDYGQPTSSLLKAEQEARQRAHEMLRDMDRKHAELSDRMSEELRYLTTSEQRRMEQGQLIRQYLPEYGRDTGFKEGFISTAGALAAGFGGYRMAGALRYGPVGTAAIAGMSAMAGYGFSRIAADELDGNINSMTARRHLTELNTIGPLAAYTARSDWQNYQGSIPSPEYFRTTVGAPADAIAQAWNLNPSQFLPGAMDLIREGVVSSGSASSGRSVRDALRESAEIFKAIQAFFGTVDIAGLTQRIKQLQAAGFTTEGMTDLGRTLQRSTLAFAPDNIRELVQQMAVQAGSAFSGAGLSATLGGQAAISGFESAYTNFGKLSDYERTVFRTQEQLGQTLTGVIGSPMSNPFLLMGAGRAGRGLDRIAGNFDLASPEGIRNYRKTLYEVSSGIGLAEQTQAVDNGVEEFMQMFGVDRETAASMYFQDEQKGMAYMIQYRGRGDTLRSNVSLFARTGAGGYLNATGIYNALQGAVSSDPGTRVRSIRSINASGEQGRMLRHMIRTRAYGSAAVSAEELGAGTEFGYIDMRALNRLRASTLDTARDWTQENIISGFGVTGEDMFRRFAERDAGGAERMAIEMTGLMRGYENAASGAEVDPEVRSAVDAITSSAGASRMLRVLQEELRDTGRGMRPEELAKLSADMGLTEVARVLSNPGKRGAFLRSLEDKDNRLAAAMSRSLTGVSSLDNARRLRASLSTSLFSERAPSGIVTAAGNVLSNPIVSAGIAATTGIITGVATLNPMAGIKAAGWAYTGAQALGMGLTALGGLDASGLSAESAQRLNNEGYGLEAVIMSIIGTFPEGMFSAAKALSLWKPEDRVEAAHGAALAIYGKTVQLYRSDPGITDERAGREVFEHVISSLSALSDNNSYISTLIEHYRKRPDLIARITSIILSYLKSVSEPETSQVVAERVREKVSAASTDWLRSKEQRSQIEAYRGLVSRGDSSSLLEERAGVTREDAQRMTRTTEDMTKVIRENVKSVSGGKVTTTEDVQRVINTINKAAAGLAKEDQGDPEKVEKAVENALASAGYDAGSTGINRLISLMEGVYSKSDKTGEMSLTAKRILADILSDVTIKTQLKEIFGSMPQT